MNSKHPFLKVKPLGNSVQIGIVLPRTLRTTNEIAFRATDTKFLIDVVQEINRGLKQIIKRDWSEVFIQKVEVACTVNLGSADKTTTDSLMNLLSRTLLQADKVKKNSPKCNTVKTKPQVKYVTGERRKGFYFIKDEVTKSLETQLWSNRRLKIKAYSKGAYSEFGGEQSIFRIEFVYCEKGIKYILGKKIDEDVTLQDLLKQTVIRKFIAQYKVDYTEIVCPALRGFLKEAEQIIYDTLWKTSAFNAFLINRDIIYDIRIFRKALKRYYVSQNKSDGAYRKMLCSITKRMEKEEIVISENVLTVFEDISKIVGT